MRSRWLGITLILGLVVSACGSVTPTAEPASEGIRVHGDWTLQIYDEDGTLDREVEFSNDLTNGAAILGVVMVGDAVFGTDGGLSIRGWAMTLADPASPASAQPCTLSTLTLYTANLDYSGGCEIGVGGNDEVQVALSADETMLTLSGSTQVTQTGSITWVETFAEATSATESRIASFTGTTIPEQTVNAGQIVQVTVEISFS